MSKSLKIILIIVSILAAVSLTAVIALSVMMNIGKKQLLNNDDVSSLIVSDVEISYNDGKTVVYNGKTYKLNENIISGAFIGVDNEKISESVIGTAGQSDFLIVCAFDVETGKLVLLLIPRDTMADIDIYSPNGKYIGIEKSQICLSFAYGDGKKSSCENVVKSLERVLYGMPINAYYSIDIAAIAPLNDAVGGVTLESLESFLDGKYEKGKEITLMGKDAAEYIRYRDKENNFSDSLRQQRQLQYVKAYSNKLIKKVKQNFLVLTDIFNTASKFSHTNIDLNEVTYLASIFLSKNMSLGEIITIPGEMKMGEQYAEYHVDNQKLLELILKVYYIEQ